MEITHKFTNENIFELKTKIDCYHNDINKLDIVKNIYSDNNGLPSFVIEPLINAINKVNLIYDLLCNECILIDINNDIPEMKHSKFIEKYLLINKDESEDEKFFIYHKYTSIEVQSRSRLFDYLVAVRKFVSALSSVNAYNQLKYKKMKFSNKDRKRLFDLAFINYFNGVPKTKLDKARSKIEYIILSDIFGLSTFDIIDKETDNSIFNF